MVIRALAENDLHLGQLSTVIFSGSFVGEHDGENRFDLTFILFSIFLFMEEGISWILLPGTTLMTCVAE